MGIDSSRGFVAIPRGLTDWEWYSEPNTARLFIHLLLTANWSQKQWQGITIHPGELVTSQSQLAKKLNLSIMQVRTALKHLESTGYITVKTGSKYSLITLNNYDLIEAGNRQITGKQQADNNNLTINNIKNINKSSSACATPEPTPTRTTSPIAEDFEQRICKLSIQGKAQLAGYADRLGEELVSEIVSRCADLGAYSWPYVRKALAEAEAQGCKSVEEYRRLHPIGSGRNLRVDRTEPSGHDFLKAAARRRRLTKRRDSMYRNPEYYPDPTVGRALEDLRRKETRLNTGKQFEADWKSSMPKDAWCYRLKDSAAAYYGGNESLSFSIDNICDFDVYRYPMHHYFELKTIDTPSIPLEKILGRFDREKQKYHKLKHITDMAHAAEFHGQTAHVVINYRGKVNRTFAISASAVLEYMNTQTRKSIPWQWAALNGIEVEQRLLRVHWRYDVEGLLKRLEGGEAV